MNFNKSAGGHGSSRLFPGASFIALAARLAQMASEQATVKAEAPPVDGAGHTGALYSTDREDAKAAHVERVKDQSAEEFAATQGGRIALRRTDLWRQRHGLRRRR